jgi:ADP-ribose pyrophosphatase YjhB (NUDIX family)
MGLRRAVKRGALRFGVRLGETMLEGLGVPRPRTLLVLGHMRSGSTLLLHLLLDHPQISGLGERNAPYRSAADLGRLVMETRVRRRLLLERLRYVADQINHDRFTPDPAVLRDRRVRILFLVRQPAATIASLLDLMQTHYQPWSVTQAVDYYVERLETLAGYARSRDDARGAGFLTYEELTERPSVTLPRLQAFLGTTPAFAETYRLHQFTGQRGDPSANIRSGRINRSARPSIPEIPAAELARATQAYERCLEAMQRWALPQTGVC